MTDCTSGIGTGERGKSMLLEREDAAPRRAMPPGDRADSAATRSRYSVKIHRQGRLGRTSVILERVTYLGLLDIAGRLRLPVPQLLGALDDARGECERSAAITALVTTCYMRLVRGEPAGLVELLADVAAGNRARWGAGEASLRPPRTGADTRERLIRRIVQAFADLGREARVDADAFRTGQRDVRWSGEVRLRGAEGWETARLIGQSSMSDCVRSGFHVEPAGPQSWIVLSWNARTPPLRQAAE